MYRRVFLIILPALAALMATLPSPGSAVGMVRVARSDTATIFDPQDAPACDMSVFDCPADIRWVTTRSFAGGTGRRMLAVTVAAYAPHEKAYQVRIMVRFDASGPPTADWYVHMGMSDGVGNWYCAPRIWSLRYRIEVQGDLMTCFIPERDLHATRPIRFRVLSMLFQTIIDRAPNQGWAEAG